MKHQTILKNWLRIIFHPVARNAAYLYSIQFANIILPLILVPYLARILKPDGLGLYLFFYALSIWLYTAIEYGFTLFATREVSRERSDRNQLERTIAAVFGAQTLLAIFIIGLAIIVYLIVPQFQIHSEYFILSLIFGIARGFGPLWYFQGQERMQSIAITEVGGRTIATLMTFFFVRAQNHGWIALALAALASIVVTLIQVSLMRQEINLRWPNIGDAVGFLKKGFTVFIYRFAASLYTTANIIILGFLSLPAIVSAYGGAEKITRGVLTLISPIIYAFYPRINVLRERDPERAWRITRLMFISFAIGGMLIMGILIFFARTWIHIFLGPGYSSAVPLLRILALEALFVPVSTVAGILCMFPMNMEKSLNLITISTGLLNIGLAIFLINIWGGRGMAITAVFSEGLLAFSILIVLKFRSSLAFSSLIRTHAR